MASYYSNTATYQQGGTAQVRADVSYSRSGTTGYNVTVKVYQTSTKSWCPYYDYSCYQYCSINGVEKRNTTSVNPTESWKRQVLLWTSTQFVDPGGPAYSCPFSVKYRVPSGAYTFSSQKTFTINDSITLPSTYVMTTQTFTTGSNNTTAGDNCQTTNASYTSQSWTNDTTASYAGDSFTYVWDKNNEANVGVNANPSSLARLCRTSSSAYDASYTNLYSAWDSTSGSGALYKEYTRTATVDDCGNYLQARIWKYYYDSSGSFKFNIQSNGHFIKAAPTLSSNVVLRSKKFYLNTPSVLVYRLNTFTINNNGYGVKGSNSSAGETGNATITKNKVHLTIDGAGYNGGFDVYYGNGRFNENYSLPITPIHIHTNKITPNNNSGRGQALAYTNWFNPRTGATGRLGLLSQDLGRPTIVSGSIDLPVIDSIVAVSGNGTTVVVEDTKKIYTTQSSPIITWRINHSGNDNGFGYDIRRTENSGSYATSTVNSGGGITPVNINSWSGTTGGIDVTSGTYNIQHNSITTSGSSQSVTIVPYIRDSANYQIFGEKTRSYVTADPYTIYLIQKPNTPTLNTWSNTLPAIDGIKDVVNWTATSPNSWGNVTDFTRGYKLRYRIGTDEPHQNGYEWYYTNTPTTTNTSFSGSFTEIYNRDEFTSCTAQIAATSYYSTVWDAYLDFQSSYSTQKSFNISAQDPYKATAGTLTTPMSTTLLNEIPFTFQCPSETINGNTLSQITKLIIDGGTEVTLPNPNYSTTTPNSLTGALTLSFSALNDSTPTLVRGAHTIQVKNEVATYFDSETPVVNHVYFGTTTVSSNVLDIEVAELPSEPTLNPADPAYHYAGSAKTLTFTFSPNDWGCLDTTHNNRHYEYQLINPSGTVISSGTIAKGDTSWSYPFTPISPDYDGVYTFKLRETTVVGSSNWVSTTVEIFPADEPSESTISSTDIIALEDWDWTLTIQPGDNGTYQAIPTSYTGTVLYTDPEFSSGVNSTKVYNNLSNGNVTVTRKAISGIPNSSGYGLEITTTGSANPGHGGFYFGTSTSANKELITKIIAKIPVGYTIGVYSNTVGEEGLDLRCISNPAGTGHWQEYWFRVKAGRKGSFSSTNFFALTGGTAPVTWQVAYATVLDTSSGSTVWSTQPTRYKVDVLKAVEDANGNITGYTEIGRTIQDWTVAANGAKITKAFTTDFDGYEDGLYRIRVQYERNYTTKTIHEEKIIDIIPPAVELYNNSYIDTCTHDSDIIKYQIKLETFAATDTSEAWYSLDYGKTWIELPQTSKSGATKTHALLLELSWLDVIYFKLHGTNPVADSTDYWIDEMPSSYLVWLSWADRTSNSIYEKLPSKTLNVITGTYTAGSGDAGSWDIKFGKWAYKASKTITSNTRGGYLHVENVMENGKMYQIRFKAKSSRARNINVRFESDASVKTLTLGTEYQEYFMNVQFNSSSTHKALTFYAADWASEEELCIKEIEVCERTTVRNEELVRRIFASLNGGDTKKMRRIEKH